MADGTVTVRILGDAKDLKSALSESDTALGNFSDKMQATGQKIMGIGAKMSAAVTLPLVAIGKVAFDAASDLNESLSKVGVVFGENAKDIEAWAQGAAKNLGMSTQSALEAAGTFGNFLQSLGLSRGPAADMSKSLVGLAADLGSFNNANPEEVLLALRSGLSGEAEPMRKFGVALSETAVKTKALEMGLGDAHGELTEGEKIQARYALIMEQTSLAQGDFARTADGAANSQKTMKAEFQDAAAEIGNKLIPIGMKLIGWVQQLIAGFSGLSDHTQTIILVVAGLAAAAGPLVTVIGALVTVVGAIISPVGLVVVGVALLAGSVIYAYTQCETFRNVVDTVISTAIDFAGTLRDLLAPMIDFIMDHVDEFKTLLIALGVVIGTAVIVSLASLAIGIGIAMVAVTLITAAAFAFIDALQWLWDKSEGVRGFLAGVFTAGLDIAKTAFGQMSDAVSTVIGWLQTLWDKSEGIRGFFADTFRAGLDAGRAAIDALRGAFDAVWGAMQRVISSVQWLIDHIPSIPSIPSLPIPSLGGGKGPGTGTQGHILRNASGTSYFGGGLTWVGEQGPELVGLPRGSRIIPNRQSMAMAGGGGASFIVENINVVAPQGTNPAQFAKAIMEGIAVYVGSNAVPPTVRRAFAS